jgi:hypothetical protein
MNIITISSSEKDMTYNMLCTKNKIIQFFHYQRGNSLIRVEKGINFDIRGHHMVTEDVFKSAMFAAYNAGETLYSRKICKGEFSLFNYLR